MRPSFRPQSIPKLRLRYPLALDHSHPVEQILSGRMPPPSGDPAHIFDLLDGLRIIVSREHTASGRSMIHVSASLDSAYSLMQDVREGRLGPDQFLAMAEEDFRAISSEKRPLEFVRFSPGKHVPHWIITENERTVR